MSFKESVQKLNGETIQHFRVCCALEKKCNVMNIYLSAPYCALFFLAGSNRFSSTSHVSMGQYSEYTDEYETYWVEFTALFNNRKKREARSPTQLYNILSIEIGLSASTLASFYRHQKSPRRTSMDKIIEWVEKEGNKKSVSFSDSSSSNNSSSSGRGSISGGNIVK